MYIIIQTTYLDFGEEMGRVILAGFLTAVLVSAVRSCSGDRCTRRCRSSGALLGIVSSSGTFSLLASSCCCLAQSVLEAVT